jgi:hypothetical protein
MRSRQAIVAGLAAIMALLVASRSHAYPSS